MIETINYKIGLAQFHIRPGEVEANLDRALKMILAAGRAACALVLLPELWSSGYDLANANRHAAATPAILAELQAWADKFQMHIAGSLLSAQADGIGNSLFWQSPGNPIPGSYSKVHLFGLMDEPRWLSAGNGLTQISAPWGATGLSVCYDLRFPELYRSYALGGASAFALSAEWPLKRIAHWQVLLRARAIENQAFMLAVNCVGKSGAETFGGSSAILSPWGEFLAQGGSEEEELLTADIDPAEVARARKFLPVFQDRRPDVYLRDDSPLDI